MIPIQVSGSNGTVTLHDNHVSLTHKGIIKLTSSRMWGEHDILLNKIIAVNIKPRIFSRGAFTITYAGSKNRINPARDENTILFWPWQKQNFIDIKKFILNSIPHERVL